MIRFHRCVPTALALLVAAGCGSETMTGVQSPATSTVSEAGTAPANEQSASIDEWAAKLPSVRVDSAVKLEMTVLETAAGTVAIAVSDGRVCLISAQSESESTNVCSDQGKPFTYLDLITAVRPGDPTRPTITLVTSTDVSAVVEVRDKGHAYSACKSITAELSGMTVTACELDSIPSDLRYTAQVSKNAPNSVELSLG